MSTPTLVNERQFSKDDLQITEKQFRLKSGEIKLGYFLYGQRPHGKCWCNIGKYGHASVEQLIKEFRAFENYWRPKFIHNCSQCGKEIKYRSEFYYKKAVETKRKCHGCLWEENVAKRRKTLTTNPRATELVRRFNSIGYCFVQEHHVPVCRGYFVDAYDPVHHVIFEYDEPSHERPENKRDDRERELALFWYFRQMDKPVRIIRYSEARNEFYEVYDSQENWKAYVEPLETNDTLTN